MNARTLLASTALTGLVIILAAQGPGIKPKPGDQLPQRPGQPRQFEPKLPLPDRTKPIIDPLANRPLNYREKLETSNVLVPGDEVVIDPPANLDRAQMKLLLENRQTKELWEVPVTPFTRVGKQPSKYTHGNVRVPITITRLGFIAPQVPRGSYEAFYAAGTAEGPRKIVEIRPRLVARSRRVGSVDGRAFVIVRPVGPLVSPRKLRTIMRFEPPGGTPRETLSNVQLDPQPVQPTITVDFTGPMALDGMSTQRADESSQARFEFRLVQVGTGRATCTSPGFENGVVSIEVRARNIPPEVEDPGRALRLVCIGDSLAWGQGLKESNKYSFLTADRMRALTGRQVTRTVFAHSGGTILSKNDADENRRLPGEVPIWFPSIPRQAELAAAAVNNRSVDLVLMDGGINDIDVVRIVNPFLDTRAEIRSATRGLKNACRDMLVDIGRTFAYRKSLIVYTGNYRIVSSKSETELMASGLATLIALAPVPGATAAGGATAAVLLGVLAVRKDGVVEQSRIFKEEITEMIQNAIGEAKNTLGTNAEDRILFVDPGYTVDHAYASLDTLLWTFGFEDEVAGQRLIDGAPHALEAPIYPAASVGHPNVQGARRFFNAIKPVIETDSARAIWDVTRPRRKMTASISRAIAVPAGTTAVEIPFRVTARDSATGANLPGNVFINGEYAGRTSEEIKHTFRRPTAANPKPTILVARPGYLDGVLAYEIDG